MNCRIIFLTMTATMTVLTAILLVVVLSIYCLKKKKQLDATEEATKPSILLSPLPPLPPIVLPSLSPPPIPAAETPAPPPAPASPGTKPIPAAPQKAPEEAPEPSIGDVRDIPMFTPRDALIPG